MFPGKRIRIANELLVAQLRTRLERIEGDRAKALALLELVRGRWTRPRPSGSRWSKLADVIDVIVNTWPTMRVDLKQTVAHAVASLPTVDGLWADPNRCGELFTGRDVAALRMVSTMYSNATCERFLGNVAALAGLAEELRSASNV